MQNFGIQSVQLSQRAFCLKACKNWIIMQNNLLVEGLYINDFHRENSMAALRAVKQMSLHPYSREQKIEQIQTLRRLSASTKENANKERSKIGDFIRERHTDDTDDTDY